MITTEAAEISRVLLFICAFAIGLKAVRIGIKA